MSLLGSSAELKCITDDPAEVCVFIEWGILLIFQSLLRIHIHIISPSGAEYCSQANYKGADPSCVQGWTSRFNFVVGILFNNIYRSAENPIYLRKGMTLVSVSSMSRESSPQTSGPGPARRCTGARTTGPRTPCPSPPSERPASCSEPIMARS